jgi:hypothetical protein
MSFDDISDDRVRGHVRTMQIICGALAAGIVTFLVVVLVLNGAPDAAAEPGVLTFISAGFFLVMLVISFLVPRIIVQGQIKQIALGTWKPPQQLPAGFDLSSESAKLLLAYQTHMIVRLAMLEGAAFFALIAYLLEGHWLALCVGIAALALLLSQFPTRGRLENWADHARAQMQAIRQWPQHS